MFIYCYCLNNITENAVTEIHRQYYSRVLESSDHEVEAVVFGVSRFVPFPVQVA